MSDHTGSNEDPTVARFAKPHGFVTRGIHWISAGLLVFGYIKGLESTAQLADPMVMQLEIIFALVLGALFLFRYVWTKVIAGATRLPADAPRWEHRLSKAVHHGLYASVFGIVLSGLGIAIAYSLPALGGVPMTLFLGLHEVFLNILPVLLLGHITGALWHKVVRRDGVLESMTGHFPMRPRSA